MTKNSKQKHLWNTGFTLIELLVVIGIIGLISTVAVYSLSYARGKSRDGKRVADLKQLQTALELYYQDNGQFPQPALGWNNWSGHCPTYGDNDTYITGLVPTYMPVLPRDPRFDVGSQCYLYNSDGPNYMVLAHTTMEAVGGDPSDASNPQYIRELDRVSQYQPTIAIYTPGAKNW